MSGLAGKVAIVTGGAGGIGAATAHELAGEGAAVAVVDPQGRLAAKINPAFDPEPTAEFLADLFRRYENPTGKRQ